MESAYRVNGPDLVAYSSIACEQSRRRIVKSRRLLCMSDDNSRSGRCLTRCFRSTRVISFITNRSYALRRISVSSRENSCSPSIGQRFLLSFNFSLKPGNIEHVRLLSSRRLSVNHNQFLKAEIRHIITAVRSAPIAPCSLNLGYWSATATVTKHSELR